MHIGYGKIQKPIVAVIAICAIAALLIIGCESNPPFSDVTISPSSVSLDAAKTNNVAFTGSGGDSNYVWSLADTTLGTISYASSNTVFYQNAISAGTNYITVTDMDSSRGNSATATITQH
jgi:hypothetical protein